MRSMMFIVGLLFWNAFLGLADAAASWSRAHLADGESTVVAVALDAGAPTRMVAATPSTLYLSVDEGRHWQSVFRLPGQATVSHLALEAGEAPAMLAATDQGVYGSFDGGARWSRVFRGNTDQERQCTQIAFHPHRPGTIVAGTRGGLFLSADRGRHWTPIITPPAAHEIIALSFNPQEPNTLYLLAVQGLFVGDLATGQWQQRRSSTPSPQDSETFEEEPQDTEEENGANNFTTVAADPQQLSTIYLGASKRVERSTDAGASWQPVTSAGLESASIQRLLLDPSASVMYAAMTRGVARLDDARDRWQLLTEGVLTTRVHDLALAPRALWAATDQGLYRYDHASAVSTAPSTRTQASLHPWEHEPTIGQVREAAIRYADVHPDKIAHWRTQARLKSLLPDVSVSGGTNLTDFRHWDSGSNPDSLLRGERDIDWSASLSWELADLMWSTDHTSIDSRSKLMVELRNDVIDEVTRLYFERRRLQLQLAADPPTDPQIRLEKELRLQELAALIDGLTNGIFSRRKGQP